ncbi:MAG: hypothetical protein ACJ8J0_20945 [Longimicrobiaceae bacterium]
MLRPAAPVIGIEVTNTFGRTIDVYNGSQYLGTLAPNAHGSFSFPPVTGHVPIYAKWPGNNRAFNISNAHGAVRYVYEESTP